MNKLVLLLVCALVAVTKSAWQGAFESSVWVEDAAHTDALKSDTRVNFVVALKTKNVEEMHNEFLSVSTPGSKSYGKFKSQEELMKKYGASQEEKALVEGFFSDMEGATVRSGEHGDLIEVSAPLASIEVALQTRLSVRTHSRKLTNKKSVRAASSMFIPDEIDELISFVSLNAPVNHVMPRAAKAIKEKEQRLAKEKAKNPQGADTRVTDTQVVGVSSGNEEALISFQVYCGNGKINQQSPPCLNAPSDIVPTLSASVTQHNNDIKNPFLIQTDPLVFPLAPSSVYCYNSYSHKTCRGNEANNCTCLAKLSPLPKYTYLQVNVSAIFEETDDFYAAEDALGSGGQIGSSELFTLTDVATASFLSDLYNIPKGISVQHGSNQSVAEWYGEFYSNPDLAQFLWLSGLPNASIPDANVYGDLANDQNSPGGEAQLDVEYIMALAPNADTYFYSMGDYNPNDPVEGINEGFLAYLLIVQNQTYPPLVHSLSYGDIEADIFNATNNGSIAYGDRCNTEFMKMGLRGLSVLISSGDDGIGNSIIRDDVDLACSQAWPAWPASSPYVTTVGATVLTNKYLPGCGMPYTVSSSYPNLPDAQQLLFECSGVAETVCTAPMGGVITSGGGFSDVSDRAIYAPWQSAAVDNYLRGANAANYPPLDYFNSTGRAYPDVSTYGSNYFIYLDGKLTRESGTSASAPVFAAMVTLWNDMRLAYDMPPMGFIAPFLYQVAATSPDAFNDITTGSNNCGVGHGIQSIDCCEYGFGATPGWDASTGLGSPNFEIIASLVLNNDSYFPNIGAYPDSGASSNSAGSSSSDDDEVKTTADTAEVIGVLGLVAGVVAILLVATMYFKCVKGGGNDKSPMASNQY